MFDDKNKKDDIENILRNKDARTESIPIHTMQGDLKSADNPAEAAKKTIESAPLPASRITVDNMSERQKTSPFLDKNTLTAKQQIVTGPPKEFFPLVKKVVPLPEKIVEPARQSSVKLILSSIIILLIVAFAGGGYYFWTTRQAEQPAAPVAEVPADTAPETPPVVPEEPATPKFSVDGPNYLQADMDSASPESLKETLRSYVQEVAAAGVAGPVEFLVVDAEKNPVRFPVFAQKLGIAYSESLLGALGDNFKLFVYNDNQNYRLGLSIDSKAGSDLETLMLKEEAKLPSELKPLFLDAAYTETAKKNFATSSYNDYVIRYNNIVSPEFLSLDYAVSSKGLIVGTTKTTIRAIIDYLSR